MKTAFSICDLWDALDTREIWRKLADVKRAKEAVRKAAERHKREAIAKLKALQGGAA